jgi:transcriptional regulator with XRE-family HTH domain
MGTVDRARERGMRFARRDGIQVGHEVRVARIAAGLSQRELARMSGVSHAAIGRLERLDVRRITIDRLAVIASVLGLELRVKLYLIGTPVRDAAHLALIDRLRKRVSPHLRLRTEVPVPLPGDMRSADVMIDGPNVEAMVEAETRLNDLQATERRARVKQRDFGVKRLILLVADTRHNRAVLEAHPELVGRFPVSTRACLLALRDGRDPGGDALVLL